MKVSIVITARNESKHLRECLDSIAAQTYPHEKIELLLVNSGSSDETVQIMRDFARKSDCAVKILENPQGDTPSGMNFGIKNASGDAVMLMNAHSYMMPDHIARAVILLNEKNVSGVSARILSVGSGGNAAWDVSVSAAMESFFGLGNSTARVSTRSGYCDNPMLALYRRELFEKFGYIDEKLTRNQDYEFNQRCAQGGATFWFQHDLKVFYHNRSNIFSLFKQYFNAAKWRAFMIGEYSGAVKLRHVIPSLFVLSAAITILASFFTKFGLLALCAMALPYFAITFAIALKQTLVRHKFVLHLIPIVFLTIHTAFGTGFLVGILLFHLLGGAKKVRRAERQ